VLAGTDCGFDTSAGMGRVAEDVVWAKLSSLVEGARLPSQRLSACYFTAPPVMPLMNRSRKRLYAIATGTLAISAAAMSSPQ
jgi:hypothetical protein